MPADNQQERLPLVNEAGEVIGSSTRGECHGGTKWLHPVVHLHVFNTAGELFLQQRPLWKDIQPGRWDTAVGGHVDWGETVEEALQREVREEIGLQVHNITFRKSKFFEPSNTLMLNFSCVAESEDLSGMTDEVDHAEWVALEESEKRIVQNSLAQEFLNNYLNQRAKERS